MKDQQAIDESIFAQAVRAGGFAAAAERLSLNSESGELSAIFGDWAVLLASPPRRVRHGRALRRRNRKASAP
jgi:hypothetical protein